MAKYRVYLETVASTVIEVEADNKDDAYDKAVTGNMPSICAQCSGWGKSQNLDLGGDWDISPTSSVDEAVEEVTS